MLLSHAGPLMTLKCTRRDEVEADGARDPTGRSDELHVSQVGMDDDVIDGDERDPAEGTVDGIGERLAVMLRSWAELPALITEGPGLGIVSKLVDVATEEPLRVKISPANGANIGAGVRMVIDHIVGVGVFVVAYSDDAAVNVGNINVDLSRHHHCES